MMGCLESSKSGDSFDPITPYTSCTHLVIIIVKCNDGEVLTQFVTICCILCLRFFLLRSCNGSKCGDRVDILRPEGGCLIYAAMNDTDDSKLQ